MVHRAWAIRGGAYAHKVSQANMDTFQRMLPDAMKAAHEASELAPADPGPWVVMLTAARALNYDHGQFSRLFAGLQTRAPTTGRATSRPSSSGAPSGTAPTS